MRKLTLTVPLLFVAVAACSKSADTDPHKVQVNDVQSADVAANDAVFEAEKAMRAPGTAADAADVAANDAMFDAEKAMRAAGTAADAADLATPSPAISANVAPGVAFDYRYSFSLPANNISAAQEGHAALCEKLGIIHCRVTSMKYNKSGDGAVNASFAFKLDPAIAHSFARDATELVEKADGTLSDSLIGGVDAGSQIVEADRNKTKIEGELAKIDVQLKIPNLSKDVRSRLVEQQGVLRGQLQELANDRDTKVESLATTPVQFSYLPNEAIFGFDNRSPVQQALRTSGSSFSTMLSFVIISIGALAPWALLGGAIFWIVRRLRAKKPTGGDV